LMIANGFKQPVLETPVKAWIVLVIGVLAGLAFAATTYVIQLQVKQVGERISWWGTVAGREYEGVEPWGAKLAPDGIHAWQLIDVQPIPVQGEQSVYYRMAHVEAFGKLENGAVTPFFTVNCVREDTYDCGAHVGLVYRTSRGELPAALFGWYTSCAGDLCMVTSAGVAYNSTSGRFWNMSQRCGGWPLAWERRPDGSVLALMAVGGSCDPAAKVAPYAWPAYWAYADRVQLFHLNPDGSWHPGKILVNLTFNPVPPFFEGVFYLSPNAGEAVIPAPGGFYACRVDGCSFYWLGGDHLYAGVGKAWGWYFAYDFESGTLYAVKPGLLGLPKVLSTRLPAKPVAVLEGGLNLGMLSLSKVAVLPLDNGTVMVVEASKLDALIPRFSLKKAGKAPVHGTYITGWEPYTFTLAPLAPPMVVQSRTPVYLLYWTLNPPSSARVVYVTEDLIALLLYIAAGILYALGQPLAAAGAAATATGIIVKGAVLGYSVRYTLAWSELTLKYSLETGLVDVQVNPIPFLPSRALFFVEHAQEEEIVNGQTVQEGFDVFYLVDGILPPDLILLLLVLALAAALTGAWVGAYIVLKKRRKGEEGEKSGMLELLVKLRQLG